MNEADDAILEFLRELRIDSTPVALPPTAVSMNLQRFGALKRAPNTVSRRMGRLEEMGLLETADEKRGYYAISNMGIAYLDGELESKDIPRPTDS